MNKKNELVSLNDVHFALINSRFNRKNAAYNLGVSLSFLNKIIKNSLLPIPTQKEFKSGPQTI